MNCWKPCIFCLPGLLLASLLTSEGLAGTWATGKAVEVDRCAAAWLIARKVDTTAEFIFLEDNQLPPKQATPFDLPVAELRRDHKRSTYESILAKYNIQDQKSIEIGKLVRLIELNFFGQNTQDARTLETDLRKLFHESADNEESYQRCFQYLDTFTTQTTTK
ncbi:chromate resistance protein ChrB domain-containing protein [Desulfogranum japonicum]|uniref:chromate resistance protein ChrB domain-containing protein n=1 Tax=Desulfogranum japonicum TaxID=231447 RepID=UPI0004129F17|nr:chromate resistance protein ChrB domain-containing protein [Desulfogranum japonicum]